LSLQEIADLFAFMETGKAAAASGSEPKN